MAPSVVPRHWHWLRVLLAPAIAIDKNRTPLDVFADLIKGNLVAFEVKAPGLGGVICVSIVQDKGRDWLEFWVSLAAGQVDGGPKRARAAMKAVIAAFEDKARSLNCREICAKGRQWRRILDDYEMTKQDEQFMFRKVL